MSVSRTRRVMTATRFATDKFAARGYPDRVMYRDVAHELDEHDHAIGSILIGETIVAGCELTARRLQEPKVTDPWLVANEAQAFPEVWRHLDRARRVLAKRGINTAGYDRVRPDAKGTVIAQRDDGTPTIDLAALDDARHAIEELKLVVAGADWDAIEQRTAGLVKVPISGKQKNRMFLGTVIGGLAVTIVTWASAAAPGHRPAAAIVDHTIHNELADIAQHRKLRIEELRVALGDRCVPQSAHELLESLVMDGRTEDARAFGDAYIGRCGDDLIVQKWVKAPPVWHSHRTK